MNIKFYFMIFVSFVIFLLPTKAARSLLDPLRSLNQVSLHARHPLQIVLEKKELGLEKDLESIREKILEDAKEYAQYRHTGSSQRAQVHYLANCSFEVRRDNPFCLLEAWRAEKYSERQQSKRQRLQQKRTAAYGVSAKPIAQAMKSADLEVLKGKNADEIRYALRRFKSWTDLESLLQALNNLVNNKSLQVVLEPEKTKVKACGLTVLSFLLATEVEESFPDPKALEQARSLYSLGSACPSENPQWALSAFRSALIDIWQKNFYSAEKALERLSSQQDLPESLQTRVKYWRYQCARVLATNPLPDSYLASALKEQKAKNVAIESAEEIQKKYSSLMFNMQRSLASGSLLSFHNLLLNGKNPDFLQALKNDLQPNIIYRTMIKPEVNSFVRGIEALLQINEEVLASELADYIADSINGVEPEFRLYVVALLNRTGLGLPKFKILVNLLQDVPRLRSLDTLRLLFPKWFHDVVATKTGSEGADPFLILSLIRQESAFNTRARSIAGARGLMQVMPLTARRFASVRRDRLYEIETNIDVGTRYFMHRLRYYDGQIDHALAAYNAGYTRVDKWKIRYPVEDKILFMDLIPFRETREYVSSILRNYFWYTQLYGDSQQIDAFFTNLNRSSAVGATSSAVASTAELNATASVHREPAHQGESLESEKAKSQSNTQKISQPNLRFSPQ